MAAAAGLANKRHRQAEALEVCLARAGATVRPTHATQEPLLLDVLGDLFNVRGFSDLAGAFAQGKAAAPLDFRIGTGTFSNLAHGLPEITLPPGVYSFSSPQTFASALGMSIRGLGGKSSVVLLYTGSSGDFLTLTTPIECDFRNVTFLNGTLAAAGPSGRQRIQLHDPAAAASTARGLVFSDSGGATDWYLERVRMEGWGDCLIPTSGSNVNCDNLLALGCTFRYNQRICQVNCDQSLMLKFLHNKWHFNYDACIDLIRGGHVAAQDIDLINPGDGFRIAKLENGQAPIILDHVRMEGFQSRDSTKKPRFIYITAGNEGEIIVRDFDNNADTDVAADVVKVDSGVVNITFEHSNVLGKLNLTPKSYSTGQNYDKYGIVKFRDCRQPVIPANVTLGAQAADGSSKYAVKYRDCALFPDTDIGGPVGGFQQHKVTLLQWYMSGNVRRLSTTVAAGSNSLTLTWQHRVRAVRVLTGSGVGNGAAVLKVWKDVAMTQQIGSDLTLAAANTLYAVTGVADSLVTAIAFSCAQATTSDVFGAVFIELEPCFLVNP